MVSLRLCDVRGWCAEWTMHSVICCWWNKSWIAFSCVLHSVRMVLLRFDGIIGCAEWVVPMVIWLFLRILTFLSE